MLHVIRQRPQKSDLAPFELQIVPVDPNVMRRALIAVSRPEVTTEEVFVRTIAMTLAEDSDLEDRLDRDLMNLCAAYDARIRAFLRTLQVPEAILITSTPGYWLSESALEIASKAALYQIGGEFRFDERSFCAAVLLAAPAASC